MALIPNNHVLPTTNDEQQLVSVYGDKNKQELNEDEKEYVEIEDITDEQYGQKNVSE